MDWSTSVAISVKANIALHQSREMPASSTLNSQMMEKEKRSSPSDPLQHICEDLQETSRHFCLASKMKNNRKTVCML